jgi:hypothetical protein
VSKLSWLTELDAIPCMLENVTIFTI